MKISIELTNEQVSLIAKKIFVDLSENLPGIKDNASVEVDLDLVGESEIESENHIRKRKNMVWIKPHTRFQGGVTRHIKGFYAPLHRGANKRSKTVSNWNRYLKKYPSNETQVTGQAYISRMPVGQEFKYKDLKGHLHSSHPMRSADAGSSITLGAEQKPPHNRIIKIGKGTYRRV